MIMFLKMWLLVEFSCTNGKSFKKNGMRLNVEDVREDMG